METQPEKVDLPVVAAIPSYNMAEQLKELLPQLLREDYEEIYVLDDCSTDDTPKVVSEIDSDISVLENPNNRGAAATRNLVLQIDRPAIIHFMDADVELLSEGVVPKIRRALSEARAGFIGGLVLDKSGVQSVWNYGPRQSLANDLSARKQHRFGALLEQDTDKARRFRVETTAKLEKWPNPLEEPARQEVFWVSEANIIINSEVFRGLGGFDPSLREHEIQDLAIRAAEAGYTNYFDPSVVVRHKEVQVRDYNRRWAMIKAEAKIARKHGFRRWLSQGF